jgi:hypothetical protein
LRAKNTVGKDDRAKPKWREEEEEIKINTYITINITLKPKTIAFGLQSHNLSIKLSKIFLNGKNSFIFVSL